MNLQELPVVLNAAGDAVASQGAYVNELTKMQKDGKTSLRVFDEDSNRWTDVALTDFFTIQYNKLISLITYQGNLNGICNNLQAALNAAIKDVAKP